MARAVYALKHLAIGAASAHSSQQSDDGEEPRFFLETLLFPGSSGIVVGKDTTSVRPLSHPAHRIRQPGQPALNRVQVYFPTPRTPRQLNPAPRIHFQRGHTGQHRRNLPDSSTSLTSTSPVASRSRRREIVRIFVIQTSEGWQKASNPTGAQAIDKPKLSRPAGAATGFGLGHVLQVPPSPEGPCLWSDVCGPHIPADPATSANQSASNGNRPR
ncbi:hypothetical protein BD289DRAFT_232824 [Coniella lustricola]|uniref:Uncharacterized protein n=1 Tax=Coniella lustricola TaxID=2025994 RepID=A0A2T3A9Y7_9PEZI|nr:hypothetical protein BD289DRAFT_232824 [Coniella lustricola]